MRANTYVSAERCDIPRTICDWAHDILQAPIVPAPRDHAGRSLRGVFCPEAGLAGEHGDTMAGHLMTAAERAALEAEIAAECEDL